MEDRQKYLLRSRKPLSQDSMNEIINDVRGAILTYKGDKSVVEADADGRYSYTLDCTEMTFEQRTFLRKSLLLEIRVLDGNGSETGISPTVA